MTLREMQRILTKQSVALKLSVPVRLPPSITMVTIVVLFSYPVVDFCCLGHIHLRMAPLVEIATLEADLTLPISVCHPPDAALGLDFHLFVFHYLLP